VRSDLEGIIVAAMIVRSSLIFSTTFKEAKSFSEIFLLTRATISNIPEEVFLLRISVTEMIVRGADNYVQQ
jgi:hypothetical protein